MMKKSWDAEITIFDDRDEARQRDIGIAVRDRAAKPKMEQQHGGDREQAQEIEDFRPVAGPALTLLRWLTRRASCARSGTPAHWQVW